MFYWKLTAVFGWLGRPEANGTEFAGGMMRRRLSSTVACLLAAQFALLLTASIWAQEGPAWDDPPDETPSTIAEADRAASRKGRRQRNLEPERAAAQERLTLSPIPTGFVFLEGEYLPPPYVIRIEGDQVLINDRPVLGWHKIDQTYNRRNPYVHRSLGATRADSVAGGLASGYVLISFDGQPVIYFNQFGAGYHLLATLVRDPQANREGFEIELPDDFDHERFAEWVDSFQPSKDLISRAATVIETVRSAEADSRRSIAANRRSETLLYLITVFGMVISVAATGHLLSAKPPSARDPEDDPEMPKMVSRSLGLVVVLSSLDLFWTIMASQQGKMIELNPIGSQLLHDPMQLIAAKATIICGSVGLLYFLRHHRQAQTAAWWACLICTLLTFRWLTFNSMFV